MMMEKGRRRRTKNRRRSKGELDGDHPPPPAPVPPPRAPEAHPHHPTSWPLKLDQLSRHDNTLHRTTARPPTPPRPHF